jgi:REP element-mobilizing transposase RayT
LRLAAKHALKHKPVEITGVQAVAVARGFRTAASAAGYRIHALAILPDHVHAVVGWHPRDIRLIVGHLCAKATKALRDLGHAPFSRVACNALNSPSLSIPNRF